MRVSASRVTCVSFWPTETRLPVYERDAIALAHIHTVDLRRPYGVRYLYSIHVLDRYFHRLAVGIEVSVYVEGE